MGEIIRCKIPEYRSLKTAIMQHQIPTVVIHILKILPFQSIVQDREQNNLKI